MKTTPFFIALILGISPSLTHAAPETCHALKFDSYFVADNVKSNIKKINPDLAHPNFAEHFLLLRAELAFETIYLIASCETGEFFHENLNGDVAKFTDTRNQLELKTKKGEVTIYEWDGKSWIKGETHNAAAPGVPVGAAPVPMLPESNAKTGMNVPKPSDAANGKTNAGAKPVDTTPGGKPGTTSTGSATTTAPQNPPAVVAPVSMLDQYRALFPKYPATVAAMKCAPLQYASYFRAQQNQSSIPKLNPDLTKPNFAGNKLLILTETMFDKVMLIADCKTGKFDDDFIKGETTFHPDSRLVLIKSSSSVPELVIWSDTQWIKLPDPVQKSKDTVKNTLTGEKAALLVKNLPNPKHLDVVRFEDLKRSKELDSIFQDLGADVIKSGKCKIPQQKAPECEVEVE